MYLQRTSWNLCSRLVTASLLVTWQSSLVRRTSVSKSAVLSTSWLPFIRELFLLRLYCNKSQSRSLQSPPSCESH